MDDLAHATTDPANPPGEAEEWDEDDENYDEDDEDYIDAEAEEIAQRLRDQLWADINAARASAGNPPAAPTANTPTTVTVPEAGRTSHPLSKKEEAAIATMQAIVAFAEKDAGVRAILESAIIPDTNDDNVFNIISRSAASRTIPKSVAKSLSNILVSLARSDTLFSTLRHPNTETLPSDKGKRKRDDMEEDMSHHENTSSKRPFYAPNDLQMQVEGAVRIVTQTLSAHSATGRPLHPAVVASVQLQLHQIFLFAVTSSAGAGVNANALQEISGLIQVIGVLSGIQIGPTADATAENPHNLPEPTSQSPHTNSNNLPGTPQVGDIGTAVYPCPACDKSFSRLYSLRAHQRIHGTERPYTCPSCNAAFARLYDLKRHTKVHETASWKCTGCDKTFSRSDAVKRHQDSARGRGDGTGDACGGGEIREVQAEDGSGDTQDGNHSSHGDSVGDTSSRLMDHTVDDGSAEEGEVQTDIIARMQSAVMSLHGLLSTQVAATLGAPPGSEAIPSADPSVGQATLASVIARAQQQSRPVETDAEVPSVGPDFPMDIGNEPLHEQLQLPETTGPAPSLASYGLSSDQALLLEQAIANAAAAAQAQAEAEAALEEGEEDGEYENEIEDAGGIMNVDRDNL
ncbi:hypothetical protein FIBSPDRAFT_8407 [Athelia psychrophila]|uniref:C2H2-type domain-containing protein n=1 Tax=Athelia psychrophila TaxID=1759441 RepID=A0A166X5L1_9AGAM|nr:hypothetical protein FIBSPDRAFT_8407 [Fibularhizoctonia sp. CBS 109695]